MKCRLLYLVGQLGPGGAERELLYLLQSLDRDRYRPEVVVWNFREDDMHVAMLRALNICLHSFPDLQSKISKLRALRQLVRHLKPEVLHSYSFYTNFAAWWATLGSATIPIGPIRNDFMSERRDSGRILGRLSARWPAAQICNSLAAEKIVEDFVGLFKPAQLCTVLNGLDMNRFKPNPTLPLKPTLLAVGRLHPQKRWDRLIKAMASVASKRIGILRAPCRRGSSIARTPSTSKGSRSGQIDQLPGSPPRYFRIARESRPS